MRIPIASILDAAYKSGRFCYEHAGFEFLYGLFDPTDGHLRYIGKSSTPRIRYRAHLKDAIRNKSCYKSNWINSLIKAGMKPVLKIIAVVDSGMWKEMEIEFIKRGRERGFLLVNLAGGGDGLNKGYVHSELSRKNMSEARRGLKLTSEHRRNISEGQRGVKRGPETGIKISIAKIGKPAWNKGVPMKPDAREKMIAALTGRRLSLSHRARLSLSQTGRKHSEKTKEKMRESYNKRIRNEI